MRPFGSHQAPLHRGSRRPARGGELRRGHVRGHVHGHDRELRPGRQLRGGPATGGARKVPNLNPLPCILPSTLDLIATRIHDEYDLSVSLDRNKTAFYLKFI